MPTIFESPKAKAKPMHTPKSPKAETKAMNPLSAFARNPNNIRFETQEEEEIVILFLRQHFIVNVPWIVLAFIMAIAPSFVFPFLFRFLQLPFALPFGYIIVGTAFWYVALYGFVLANFLHWYFNIYIVTNERVVDIDFLHLLYKHFSEAKLIHIQDISYRTGGVAAAIFNYGNVYIQTAGEMPNFEFLSVPSPDQVVATISQLMPDSKGNV